MAPRRRWAEVVTAVTIAVAVVMTVAVITDATGRRRVQLEEHSQDAGFELEYGRDSGVEEAMTGARDDQMNIKMMKSPVCVCMCIGFSIGLRVVFLSVMCVRQWVSVCAREVLSLPYCSGVRVHCSKELVMSCSNVLPYALSSCSASIARFDHSVA